MNNDETSSGTTPAAPVLLELQRLRVEFGPLVAVNDVSLLLSAGHLLGLIGPNGAGKTTLLRAAAGLHPVTRGLVRVMGEVLAPGKQDVLRHVGFTPDTPALYDDLTVRQFLRFIAMGYDLAGAEVGERIDFWLEKVWLTEKADAKIKGLSRGMRQRIGIARTLLPNPTVIFLDEPAAGIDPAGRVQFRQILASLRDQGKALVVSSHILADMDEYCTHIGIMSAGELVKYGTVAQVAAHGQADDGRCRYTIVLAHPFAQVDRTLSAIAEVSDVQLDTDRLTIEYSADKSRAADLLAQLIAMKVPIASFAPDAVGLEQAYLRTGIRQVD